MQNDTSFLYNQLNLVSEVGSNWLVVVCVVLIPVLFLFYKNYRREAYLLFITLSSFVINQLLKGIFRQPRPDEADVFLWTRFDIYGFPSGHTMFYTAFFGFLLYLSFKLTKVSRIARKITRVVCLYFIVLVGVSRIGLGAHFIQDVIGGYVFGLLFLYVLVLADKKLLKSEFIAKNKDKNHQSRKSGK